MVYFSHIVVISFLVFIHFFERVLTMPTYKKSIFRNQLRDEKKNGFYYVYILCKGNDINKCDNPKQYSLITNHTIIEQNYKYKYDLSLINDYLSIFRFICETPCFRQFKV